MTIEARSIRFQQQLGSPSMLLRLTEELLTCCFVHLSAAVYGIDADLVDIEVDLTPDARRSGISASVTIVGLPDAAVRESRERIRAAITNCGFFFPFQRSPSTSLRPTCERKAPVSTFRSRWGSSAQMVILPKQNNLIHVLCVGELSSRWSRAANQGCVADSDSRARRSIKHVILPDENAKEAAVVSGVNVYPVADLRGAVELVAALRSANSPEPLKIDPAEILGAVGSLQRRFPRSARPTYS